MGVGGGIYIRVGVVFTHSKDCTRIQGQGAGEGVTTEQCGLGQLPHCRLGQQDHVESHKGECSFNTDCVKHKGECSFNRCSNETMWIAAKENAPLIAVYIIKTI